MNGLCVFFQHGDGVVVENAVVEGADNDLVIPGKVFDLVKSTKLVTLFGRIGYTGQYEKDSHAKGFRSTKVKKSG
jgi:hypothetical protein